MTESLSGITLYGYWRSSSSWRVRIAFNLKGIEYRVAAVHLIRDGGDQHRPEFVSRNPMHQVPVIEFTESEKTVSLRQSVAIMEWLEERFPEPPLLPRQPLLRARTREVVEVCNSGIQPHHNLETLLAIEALGGSRLTWAKPFVQRGLEAIEEIVTQTAKTFAVGEFPSLADVCIVPQLYAARRFEVDLEAFPTLRRIEASCMAVEAFRLAHPDEQLDAPTDN